MRFCSGPKPWSAALLALASLAGVIGCTCRGCHDEVALAVLERASGAVDEQSNGAKSPWRTARLGHRFSVGEAVRTGAGAHAALAFIPDGRMQVGEETIVRFLETLPQAPQKVGIEGAADVTTLSTPIDIETGQGRARLQQRSRAAIRKRNGATVINVHVGRVTMVAGGASAGAGERLLLRVGTVVTEPLGPADVALSSGDGRDPAAPSSGDDGPSGATPADAMAVPGVRFAQPGIVPDLIISDDDGPVMVHTPAAAVRLGFVQGHCSGTQRVEIEHDNAVGGAERLGMIVAELGPGEYHYRRRCSHDSQDSEYSGRLAIDTGVVPHRLPPTAPVADINADGRRYTVHYQSRLPHLRFHWPGAPASKSYHLAVTAKGGARKRLAEHATPDIELAPGTLAEGTYRFRMVTAGGRSSRAGSVRIVFDNTASAGYLSAPENLGFRRAEPVPIRGAARPGSRIHVGDTRLAVRRDGRFFGKVVMEDGRRALAIRIQHRRHGTHYYLRYPSD